MDNKNYRIGIISALTCNLIWGVLPIYWNALKPIDSFVVIFYRIVLMTVVCFLATCISQGKKDIMKPMLENRKAFLTYFIGGITITINWSIYIWAVNSGHVIQTSLGYFIEPLVVCLFGILIYKEKVNTWKKIAIAFAVAGLGVMVVGYGEMPVIALSLGVSFAVYSAIKKSVNIGPFHSLFLETLFITPFALIAIIFLESKGIGAIAVGSGFKYFLMMFAGLFTAIPLGLFSFAANKIPLITIGICEYISPSMSLVIGIFILGENFEMIQLISFAIIWVGLAFFTYGEVKEVKEESKRNQ